MTKPVDLGRGVSFIDLYDLNMKERTGSYVLHSEDLTIVETSASPSIPHLLKGLQELQLDPNDVKYIIVTHIHLDHAGGVGVLLDKCPNAKVVVHPKGQRHLINPSRLIAGARAVYGELFDSLFNPILPVPEERLIVKQDGETLEIGRNRLLTFWDTPGHANHHFSIHDSYSNGIFTGDTIGVFYPQTKKFNFEFVLPSTSPNQFDPDKMLQSLHKIKSLNVDRIYFGHYGMTKEPNCVYAQIKNWLPIFISAGEKIRSDEPNTPLKEQVTRVSNEILVQISAFLQEQGVPLDDEVFMYLNVDIQVCSMGILDYLAKR